MIQSRSAGENPMTLNGSVAAVGAAGGGTGADNAVVALADPGKLPSHFLRDIRTEAFWCKIFVITRLTIRNGIATIGIFPLGVVCQAQLLPTPRLLSLFIRRSRSSTPKAQLVPRTAQSYNLLLFRIYV